MNADVFLRPELEFILKSSKNAFEALKNKRILITGGTGFIGTWLVRSFLCANESFALNAEIFVLSRDPESFLKKNPPFRNRIGLKLIQGDLLALPSFEGDFYGVIHAATSAHSAKAREEKESLDLNVEGTKTLLEFCKNKKIKRYLYTSTGAVYGEIPARVDRVTEEQNSSGDSALGSSYAAGKRSGENLSLEAAHDFGFEATIARIFAVIGPGMPLQSTYAAGNFVYEAVTGQDIHIQGDGTPLRNFISITDLTSWLWNLLVFGKSLNAYNLAGEETVSIRALAELIKEVSHAPGEILVAQKPSGAPPSRYLGSNEKIKRELNLQSGFTLRESVQRSVEWARQMEIQND